MRLSSSSPPYREDDGDNGAEKRTQQGCKAHKDKDEKRQGMKLAKQVKPLNSGKVPDKKGKLGESGMKLLEEDLRARPAVTYEERADLLCERLGVKVSKATIYRVIKRLGYIRKKDQWVQHKETNGSERLGG